MENPPPQTPTSKPSDPVPYPTTFVQAHPSSFKQVVQMLTGSAETAAAAAAAPKPHAAAAASAKGGAPGPKKPAFKLYERRSTLKSLKILSPLIPTFVFSSPNSPIAGAGAGAGAEVLSPSVLDLPSLVLSPVTPLLPDPFGRPPPPPPPPPPQPGTQAAEAAEERAIAEKGFYLHPSPRGGGPPRLLPLFPVTSPRAASASVSASASASASA